MTPESLKKETLTQVFPCGFCEIFKNISGRLPLNLSSELKLLLVSVNSIKILLVWNSFIPANLRKTSSYEVFKPEIKL